MYFLLGNFADPTIALLQWAFIHKLENLTVLSVDTGWAAASWAARIEEGARFAHRLGFKSVHLRSAISFPNLIRDRQQFPSPKYGWCAGILKGLPINDYLDQVDPRGEGTVLLPYRRYASRLSAHASEIIEASEHHGGRRLWLPLLNHTREAFDALLTASELPRISHRSLECDPCIYSNKADMQRLDPDRRQEVVALEHEIGTPFFLDVEDLGDQGISYSVESALKHEGEIHPHPPHGPFSRQREKGISEYDGEQFSGGCGSPWGCGQ